MRYSSGASPTAFGYTGQRADAATGLDYYHARYYDPVAQQFVSADTVADGLSRYGYAGGNPTTMIDPSGHRYTCPDNDCGGGSPPPVSTDPGHGRCNPANPGECNVPPPPPSSGSNVQSSRAGKYDGLRCQYGADGSQDRYCDAISYARTAYEHFNEAFDWTLITAFVLQLVTAALAMAAAALTLGAVLSAGVTASQAAAVGLLAAIMEVVTALVAGYGAIFWYLQYKFSDNLAHLSDDEFWSSRDGLEGIRTSIHHWTGGPVNGVVQGGIGDIESALSDVANTELQSSNSTFRKVGQLASQLHDSLGMLNASYVDYLGYSDFTISAEESVLGI